MKNQKILVGLFISATALTIASCGGSEEGNEVQNVDLTDSTETSMDSMNSEMSSIDYAVPTPNELFEIIKIQGGEQKSDLVNPLENSENYVSQTSKSINFGVYSADVAYLSCFGIGIDFLKYFKQIESLGEEIGVSGAFDEDMMDRIENNEGNSDSLFAISNDSYYNSYYYLEENGKGTELSLIMVGGFVESLYIITNLVETYDDENPVVKKIGDQNLVIENLIDFISQYSEGNGVSDVIGDMMDLKDVFEANMEFEDSESSVSNEGGTLVLSGGGNYKMTEGAFNAIKEKVTELRTNYTK